MNETRQPMPILAYRVPAELIAALRKRFTERAALSRWLREQTERSLARELRKKRSRK